MKVAYTPNIAENQDIKRRKKTKSQVGNWKDKVRLIIKRSLFTLIAIAIMTITWSVYRFTWKSTYFTLENVEVSQTEHISKDDVMMEMGVLPRANLMKISAQDIKKRLTQNPWIKSVQVIKRYPSSLFIRISERKPMALVVGKDTWGIDEQGYLLPGMHTNAATQLPLITVNEKINPDDGDRIRNESMKQAIYILERINRDNPELMQQISEINITHPENIVLYTQPDGTEVRLGNENLAERLSKLFKIWKVARDRNLVHEYIDLRFDDQGVITKPRVIKNPKKGKNSSPST